MNPQPSNTDVELDNILFMCNIYGTLYETWNRENQEHIKSSFLQSPNCKEAKAAITALIRDARIDELRLAADATLENIPYYYHARMDELRAERQER